jgi:hypothetical protein
MVTMLASACVPSTQELLPRGAAGVALQPTAATRGEPFITEDGWTVRFEKLALQWEMSALSTSDFGGGGLTTYRLWSGAAPTKSYIPAIPVGPCVIGVGLAGLTWFRSASSIDRTADFAMLYGIDPALVERFSRSADNVLAIDIPAHDSRFDKSDFERGPAIVFVVRAEKAGQVVTLDLALAREGGADLDTVTPKVEVRANDVAYADVVVGVERLFIPSDASGPRFQEIADADANGDGDGVASVGELRAVPAVIEKALCPPADDPSDIEIEPGDESDYDTEETQAEGSGGVEPCSTLLDLLAARAAAIFPGRR